MKKVALSFSVFFLVLVMFVSTSFAIYNGEKTEPPKEGEMQILSVPTNDGKILNKENMTKTTMADEEKVMPISAPVQEEKENKTVWFASIASVVVLALGLGFVMNKKRAK